MVALAHDVFNMGTNETWDYNERERHLHDLARPKQGRARGASRRRRGSLTLLQRMPHHGRTSCTRRTPEMAAKDMAERRVSAIRQIYDRAAARHYREQDEVALAKGGSKRHYCEILGRLTRSFDRKIDVLDAGCGTGRYFQCLRNVRRLVGVDISEHMIEEARNPVARGQLDVESIELHVGDVSSLNLEPASFDFICSLGVIGEFAPVDAALLDTFARLLKDDGILFFTAVDTHSRTSVPDRNAPLLRRAARRLFPYLAPSVRAAMNKRLAPHYLSRNELAERLEASPFASFEIARYDHPPGGWAGAHLDAIAVRGQANPAS